MEQRVKYQHDEVEMIDVVVMVKISWVRTRQKNGQNFSRMFLIIADL